MEMFGPGGSCMNLTGTVFTVYTYALVQRDHTDLHRVAKYIYCLIIV